MGGFRSIPTPLKIAALYLAVIGMGAALLAVPASSQNGLTVGEALFTATSAVTVTGLSVITAGDDLTVFGQVVLALLIELGGLGLIVMTVAVLAALGVRVGIAPRTLLKGDLGTGKRTRLALLVRRVLKITLAGQALAALLLACAFVPEYGWAQGGWHAVFHAVSAFNHAGFDLFGNSLKDYSAQPFVLLVVSTTFILSSLGFIVYADLRESRRWSRLTLHSRLMIVGTVLLLVAPFGLVCALEWTNPATLGGVVGAADRLINGWFLTATTRTAGFASLDTGELRPATTWLVMALMIIGGGSGSTSGGIKITTVAVLVLAAIAYFRKSRNIRVFRMSVAGEQVQKALALMLLTLLVYLVATFVLLATQTPDPLDLQFEAMSALGTVGLSRGITGDLDGVGRGVIMGLMVIGRLGPLTLGYLIAASRPPLTRYPNGTIHLG